MLAMAYAEPAFGEALTWAASDLFDLRVKQSLHTPRPWAGDVSLRDMLGAQLVTYDTHLPGWNSDALAPKAVYVQYQSPDPVTGAISSVIAPAEMSLDIFVDPNLFAQPVEEEEEVFEEEKDDHEEEDRRKLRSSIRGDPILLRANPAPPPDPYFAPVRHETLKHARHHPKSGTKLVEHSATMSTFMKASGKDKYARSRMSEIDKILNAKDQHARSPQGPQQPGDTPPRAPGSFCGSPSAASDAGASVGGMLRSQKSPRDPGAGLSAHMAMHIQRMPTFHKGHMIPLDTGPPELEASEGDGATASGAAPGDDVGHEGADGTERRSPGPSLPEAGPAPSPTSPTSPTDGVSLPTPRSRRPGRGRVVSGLHAGAKQVLRDMDPHLESYDSVPTQRMHSNWPDGPRRQLARHFYGMSPARILEEEEKERLREQLAHRARSKSVVTKSELGTEDSVDTVGGGEAAAAAAAAATAAEPVTPSSPLTARAKERARALERGLACGTEGGKVNHRLEIRIKNTERAHRVVVARHTDRLRGPEEASTRPTVVLGKLHAESHLLKR